MKKFVKILSVFTIITMFCVILGNSVLATEADEDLAKIVEETLQGGNSSSTQEIKSVQETNNTNSNNDANSTSTTNTTATTNTTTTNTSSSSTDETLPKTGITEDYAILAFAVISIVAAIYAYTRVKKYNNI